MHLLNPSIPAEQQQAIFRQLETENKEAQNRQIWLTKRSGKFSASSIHKLITSGYKKSKGKTRSTYIMEKVAERLGSTRAERNFRETEWGKQNEPLAIKEYEKRKNTKVHQLPIAESFITICNHSGAHQMAT